MVGKGLSWCMQASRMTKGGQGVILVYASLKDDEGWATAYLGVCKPQGMTKGGQGVILVYASLTDDKGWARAYLGVCKPQG